MAFFSDPKACRTYDPQSGWELFRTPSGMGSRSFELRHPAEPPISFWFTVEAQEYTGRQIPDGRREIKQTVLVKSINGRIRSASSAQKHLVEEAIHAFGGFFDGPIGPVEVKYLD